MALAGKGVLAIWNGIDAEAEADFVAWHIREHIPERVAVPGFRKGRRYVALRGAPKYFNFYETDDVAVLGSPAYLARLNDPSDWTKRVVRHFRDTSRTACRVAASAGTGDGGVVGTLRLTASAPAATVTAAVAGDVIAALMQAPGIVAVHLLEGEPQIAGGPTAEKALRDRPDATAAWILLIEAADAEALEAALAGPAAPAALARCGAVCDQAEIGVYRLQYALARTQLA